MPSTTRLQQVRTGFAREFWIANVLELFERFAYYASKAVLAVYVAEQVGLGPEAAGWLVGSLFNTLLYFLPPLAGTVVDRYGFKRSLMFCFAIFSVGYFLIGFGGVPAGQPLVQMLGPRTYMIVALLVTAVGGSLIKPSVVGTVARTTTNETKSLGYSIYYMLVNIGGAIGPLLAVPGARAHRDRVRADDVLGDDVPPARGHAPLLQGAEAPGRPRPVKSMGRVVADMGRVFGDARFMAFLVIFSGFWVMFWQIFYSLPFYVRDVLHYSRFEVIETVDAWTIILVTVPATALARRSGRSSRCPSASRSRPRRWFVMGSSPTLAVTVAAIVMFAVGEAIQAPPLLRVRRRARPPATRSAPTWASRSCRWRSARSSPARLPASSSPPTCRDRPRRSTCGTWSDPSASCRRA